MNNDCIFCKIVEGSIPAEKILETDDLIAFKDIHPVAPVHILVISKKHYDSVLEIPSSELGILSKLFAGVQTIAIQTGIAKHGFRTLTNTGKEGGQVVPHLHFHVLGGRKMGALG